ncbi:MAG TPA: response regulator [Anaeromyxobacteraceae bacterium]|nr:response regulator [Anaeromyxobacteraceae bacterium]
MTNDALVLAVDDDAAVRTALARILRSAGYAVETFPGARQLLARLPTVTVPCCVVTDLRMPGMDGLALQEELCAGGAPALVFLTGYADVPTTLRVMKRGAVDVLQKPVGADALVAAVDAALRRACEEAATRDLVQHDRVRYVTLTPRERQVFALVTAGLLNKQVGYELGTSEKTVKVQRARVMEKMGARSLPDLVRMADRLGVGAAGGAAPAWAGVHPVYPAPVAADAHPAG